MFNANTAGVGKSTIWGSDYHPLWESLQGKNTGWCTAGADTCKNNLLEDFMFTIRMMKRRATNPFSNRMDGKRIKLVKLEELQESKGLLNQTLVGYAEEEIKDFPTEINIKTSS